MNIGQKGYIVKVKGHGSVRKRMVDTGLYKGIFIELLDKNLLAGSVSLDIEGERCDILLPEASLIEVLTTEEATQEMQVTEVSTGALKEMAHRHRHHIDIALVGQPLSGKNSLFTTAIGGETNPSAPTNEIQTGIRDFQDYHLLQNQLCFR